MHPLCVTSIGTKNQPLDCGMEVIAAMEPPQWEAHRRRRRPVGFGHHRPLDELWVPQISRGTYLFGGGGGRADPLIR
jgi:hypothetical protein